MFNSYTKKNFLSKYGFYILVGIIALVILFSMRSCHKSELSILKELNRKQQQAIEEQYTKEISGLEKTISGLNDDVTESKQKYNSIKKKIVKNENKIEAVKPPEGTNEILQRFDSLGYQSFICR